MEVIANGWRELWGDKTLIMTVLCVGLLILAIFGDKFLAWVDKKGWGDKHGTR
jgi:hypothetical protein